MANSQFHMISDLVEDKVYPIVGHVMDFFGFGFDRPTDRNCNSTTSSERINPSEDKTQKSNWSPNWFHDSPIIRRTSPFNHDAERPKSHDGTPSQPNYYSTQGPPHDFKRNETREVTFASTNQHQENPLPGRTPTHAISTKTAQISPDNFRSNNRTIDDNEQFLILSPSKSHSSRDPAKSPSSRQRDKQKLKFSFSPSNFINRQPGQHPVPALAANKQFPVEQTSNNPADRRSKLFSYVTTTRAPDVQEKKSIPVPSYPVSQITGDQQEIICTDATDYFFPMPKRGSRNCANPSIHGDSIVATDELSSKSDRRKQNGGMNGVNQNNGSSTKSTVAADRRLHWHKNGALTKLKDDDDNQPDDIEEAFSRHQFQRREQQEEMDQNGNSPKFSFASSNPKERILKNGGKSKNNGSESNFGSQSSPRNRPNNNKDRNCLIEDSIKLKNVETRKNCGESVYSSPNRTGNGDIGNDQAQKPELIKARNGWKVVSDNLSTSARIKVVPTRNCGTTNGTENSPSKLRVNFKDRLVEPDPNGNSPRSNIPPDVQNNVRPETNCSESEIQNKPQKGNSLYGLLFEFPDVFGHIKNRIGGSSTVPGSPCSNGGDNVRIQSGLRKAPSTESDGLAMTSSTQLNSSASMFAVNDRQPACSDDPEVNSEKLGRIQFSISYDFPEMTLTLRIIRAVELPAKDFSGTSDPYVKIMLLPDKKRKLTTNVKRKNLNPRWNEVFAFEGFPYPKLMNKTLYMQVLDYDRFSRDDPIGEVCIPLSDFDLTSGQTLWKNLQPCKSHMGKLGELYLGLCYHPTNGQLTVNVQKARELKAKDINGLSDPYVKIWLMFDGKKTEKKKTTTMEKTLNPVYNESFAFEVQYEKIRQTSLMISVMDYDRMGRNEQIGQILLGSKSGPMEVKHWNEMFSKARQEVFHWHILKDFG